MTVDTVPAANLGMGPDPETQATMLLTQDIAANSTNLQGDEKEIARRNIISAATKLIERLETPIEQINRFVWGEPTRFAAMKTAFNLGLFQKLTDKPLSSGQLAQGTIAEPELVARTMKHLAAYGLVGEAGKDLYTGTSFSASMNNPTMRAGWMYSFEALAPILQGLPDFLAKTNYRVPTDDKHGPAQFALKTDKPIFDYHQENERLGAAFNTFMTAYTTSQPRWIDIYPGDVLISTYEDRTTGQAPLLVDIGGGVGHDIAAFHARFPKHKGELVLEDTAQVLSQAREESDIASTGIKLLPHDFFTPQPNSARGAKAYFMRQILHDWPEERCRVILGHVRDAMVPGYSRLLIHEQVLADQGAPWQQTALDWTMMGMLVSRERTTSQWTELLNGVGLTVAKIWRRPGPGESVIEAVRE